MPASGKTATRCQDIKTQVISPSPTFVPFAGSSGSVNRSQEQLKDLGNDTGPSVCSSERRVKTGLERKCAKVSRQVNHGLGSCLRKAGLSLSRKTCSGNAGMY